MIAIIILQVKEDVSLWHGYGNGNWNGNARRHGYEYGSTRQDDGTDGHEHGSDGSYGRSKSSEKRNDGNAKRKYRPRPTGYGDGAGTEKYGKYAIVFEIMLY